MDQNNSFNLDFALLSWTRIQYDLSKNEDNVLHLRKNLQRLEEYLQVYGIEKIQILDPQPSEFYVIEFLKDGELQIKELLVEEVEKFY